jgi:hypothetical protein
MTPFRGSLDEKEDFTKPFMILPFLTKIDISGGRSSSKVTTRTIPSLRTRYGPAIIESIKIVSPKFTAPKTS